MLILGIILDLLGLTSPTGRSFILSFPLEEFDAKIKELGMDYLRQTHRVREGLLWKEVVENIPDDMCEKHGFHKPTGDWDYVNAIPMYKPAYAYLIPPKEARLMEAASRMTMFLMENFESEIRGQSPDGLREKISDFVLVWVPRYVDFGDGDLWEFTESALEQSSFV